MFIEALSQEGDLAPTKEQLPPEAEQRVSQLAGLGFKRVAKLKHPSGGLYRVLLNDTGDTLAEVTWSESNQRMVVELTSELGSRQGILCTSTSGQSLNPWFGELRQVFPDAEPPDLLTRHQAGLQYLAAQGLEPQRMERDSLPALRFWVFEMQAEALRALPKRDLSAQLRRLEQGLHENVGAIEENPTSPSKIAFLTGG